MQVINVNHLKKMYNETDGVKDVSFNVNKGEAIAIVGASGSGKSTILKLLVNLLNKDSGKITFYNKTLDDNYEELMRQIAYVPDRAFDFPKETVRTFLNYVAKYYQMDYQENIEHFAKIFNLDLDKEISLLPSGGIQKICLVYALFHEPDILILDEPTNYLDNKTVNVLKKELLKQKNKGRAIVIASHQLSFINEVCDKIYILKNNTLSLVDKKNFTTDFKKITFISEDKIKDDDFLKLKGVNNFIHENNYIEIIYCGDISILLKKIIAYETKDISIVNPDINEIIEDLLK